MDSTIKFNLIIFALFLNIALIPVGYADDDSVYDKRERDEKTILSNPFALALIFNSSNMVNK